MGFFQKIQQFMYGRNGFDTYTFFLFIVALAVSTANFFVWGYWASLVLYVVQLLILAYAVFRILSKSVHKRSAENRRFVAIWTAVKNFFILQKNRLRDIKKYRYRKCKYCKATLRLKRRRGKHTVRCPKCHGEFKVNIVV
ncbi:MAG: hypothetical protein IJF19_01090 [Clostridia bacterium]|nr:hypothetical protein [Clostridia bacterium]